jgi:hypothetical protein
MDETYPVQVDPLGSADDSRDHSLEARKETLGKDASKINRCGFYKKALASKT